MTFAKSVKAVVSKHIDKVKSAYRAKRILRIPLTSVGGVSMTEISMQVLI